MLKVGLVKDESVVTTQSVAGGCGCNKNSVAKMSQSKKESKLQALTEKMNKTKNSIYKTTNPTKKTIFFFF
jgi:hypothetical protein